MCPHYDFRYGSTLTLEEAGKTAAGGPVSVCDLAKTHGLKQVVIVDDTLGGFIEGYRNLTKAGVQMIFGVKITVCADETDKTDESLKTESSVIIFVRNTAGYSDLIRIYNRAWTTNHHKGGRTSWRELKALWTDNLTLALPFFSSFIARNLLSFSNVIPDFPVKPTVFLEQDSGLPFAPAIESAARAFAESNGLEVQPTKSIYYEDGPRDFDAYATFRALGTRGQYQRPGVDHMCSDRFSYNEWARLAAS